MGRRAQEPLLIPSLFFAAGITLAWLIPDLDLRECLLAAIALACIAVAAFRFKAQLAGHTAVSASLLFAGGAAMVWHRLPEPPKLSVDDGNAAILEGCVVDPALVAADREKFVLELAPGARAQVSLFSRTDDFPALPYGVRIELTGKTRTPHNYNNPGSFDFAHYLARQSVYWNVSANADTVHVLPGRCGNWLLSAVFSLRMNALERLDRLYAHDAYANGMMQAILIGATAKLERMWTDDYRSTGTYHALVISGSHVALIAAVLLFLLRVCMVPEGAAVLLTVCAAWLYAGVTGWQAPVLRSAAGMSLYATARVVYREGRLLNILAGVAFLFLLADPEQLFDASFQLSFLAAALIGAFAAPAIDRTSGPLARGLRHLAHTGKDIRLEPRVAQFRIEMRLLADTLPLPRKFALICISVVARVFFFFWEIAITSSCIQIGLALPMVTYFHRLSASGISANAIVVPVLSALVPIGFAAIAFMSSTLAAICTWLLAISRWAVTLHAQWEPNWRIPAPPVWLGLLFVLALLAAAWRWDRRARAFGWVAAAVALGAIVLHPFSAQTLRGTFELTAIDVGQGDSLLAAFPDGKLMLIDAGGIPSFLHARKSSLDIGEDVVSPYLWSRSIKRLDVVAMTHAHEDHMGGMSAVLRNFHPHELWTGAVNESAEWKSVRATAEELHIPIREMRQSPAFEYGGAQIAVLAPLPDYEAREKPSNDDSLVMRIGYGINSFLLTGDMEKKIEEQLFYSGLLSHADVLKVGHHGSRTSSTADLLDTVHPAFGLISVGFENSYGHPHPLTIKALDEHRVHPWRTDEQGLITVRSDGRRISVEAYSQK